VKNSEVLNDIICAGDLPESVDSELSHEIAIRGRHQTAVDCFHTMLSKALALDNQTIIDDAHKVLRQVGYTQHNFIRLNQWLSEDV